MGKSLNDIISLMLYAINESTSKINKNTLMRYIYLFAMADCFVNKESTINISFSLKNGIIAIDGYDTALTELCTIDFIEKNDDEITLDIKENLIQRIGRIINNSGELSEMYKKILPFVNVLKSYSDEMVFDIFFNEPTFRDALIRRAPIITTANSELSTLLSKFQKKVSEAKIDEYDILAYWMEYALSLYVGHQGGNSDEK